MGPNIDTKQAAQGAGIYMDNCPLDLPAVDTVCTAIEVGYFRHRVPEIGYEPWQASAVIEDVLVHPDGTFDILGDASVVGARGFEPPTS
jgi:hypothetical protein